MISVLCKEFQGVVDTNSEQTRFTYLVPTWAVAWWWLPIHCAHLLSKTHKVCGWGGGAGLGMGFRFKFCSVLSECQRSRFHDDQDHDSLLSGRVHINFPMTWKWASQPARPGGAAADTVPRRCWCANGRRRSKYCSLISDKRSDFRGRAILDCLSDNEPCQWWW